MYTTKSITGKLFSTFCGNKQNSLSNNNQVSKLLTFGVCIIILWGLLNNGESLMLQVGSAVLHSILNNVDHYLIFQKSQVFAIFMCKMVCYSKQLLLLYIFVRHKLILLIQYAFRRYYYRISCNLFKFDKNLTSKIFSLRKK